MDVSDFMISHLQAVKLQVLDIERSLNALS